MILADLIGRLRGKEQSNTARYHQLVVDLVDGKTRRDAEEVIAAIGRSADEVTADVAAEEGRREAARRDQEELQVIQAGVEAIALIEAQQARANQLDAELAAYTARQRQAILGCFAEIKRLEGVIAEGKRIESLRCRRRLPETATRRAELGKEVLRLQARDVPLHDTIQALEAEADAAKKRATGMGIIHVQDRDAELKKSEEFRALAAAKRAELERLRQDLSALRRQVEALERGDDLPPGK